MKSEYHKRRQSSLGQVIIWLSPCLSCTQVVLSAQLLPWEGSNLKEPLLSAVVQPSKQNSSSLLGVPGSRERKHKGDVQQRWDVHCTLRSQVTSASDPCPLLFKQNGCLLPRKSKCYGFLNTSSASSSWGGLLSWILLQQSLILLQSTCQKLKLYLPSPPSLLCLSSLFLFPSLPPSIPPFLCTRLECPYICYFIP